MNKFSYQLKQSVSYLDRRDKFKLSVAILCQIFLALVDMAGAAGLGFLGVIAAASVTNTDLPKIVLRMQEFLNIADYPVTKQITALGLIVVLIFIGKTLGSLYLNRRILLFLAARQVRIASEIFSKVLKGDYLAIAGYSRQGLVQAVTDSLNVSLIGILGNFMLAISEIILLAFLFALLAVVYPAMALLTLLIFGTLAYVTQSQIGKRTREFNAEYSRAAVESKTHLMDSLSVLPEIKVSGRFSLFIDKFRVERARAAEAYINSLWLGQVPKFVLEIGLVLSGMVVYFFTQITSSSVDAIGRIIVFLAVSGRLVPSLLRLQSEVIGMHANIGLAEPINTLRDKLESMSKADPKVSLKDVATSSGLPVRAAFQINFEKVSFVYDDGGLRFEFGDFSIARGHTVAIIGKSGVGKTTLVQLIMGLVEPTAGSVKLNEKSPRTWTETEFGSISYLPQAIEVVSGNIEENIALGIPTELIDERKLKLALEIAALDDWLKTLPLGVKTSIGEKGFNFSGGQLQRIGIARAVYDEPKLIILDEPTSSLDDETEEAFLKMISHLHGKTTIVMITHKLKMISHVDEVLLLEEKQNVVSANFINSNEATRLKSRDILED
jgi:ABC-type multidrug transport system fused ATPase/permease subunit